MWIKGNKDEVYKQKVFMQTDNPQRNDSIKTTFLSAALYKSI